MDYIKKFDIELEREYYYAGERLRGHVVIHNTENLKVRGVRVMLRGKAHVEWKVSRGGERRTVREDQYFVDDKTVVWGKDKHEEGSIAIMPRGEHRYPFEFTLPESTLPCSFESRHGNVRYYLRVLIDIPYASPPQGIKYWTLVGPHIDCMDDKYLQAVSWTEEHQRCCLCCVAGAVQLEATLERSAYVCGERVKLRCDVQNGGEDKCWVVVRLIQHVQFRVNKGVLGLTKDVKHKVWEVQGPSVEPHSSHSLTDLQRHLTLPVLPPTHVSVCKVLDICYILQVCVKSCTSGEYLHMDFPLTVATLPFRVPTAAMPTLHYEVASEAAEGGQYVSPEFLLGQVYDGDLADADDVILYRPVYACVHPPRDDDEEESPRASTSREGNATLTSSNKEHNTNHSQSDYKKCVNNSDQKENLTQHSAKENDMLNDTVHQINEAFESHSQTENGTVQASGHNGAVGNKNSVVKENVTLSSECDRHNVESHVSEDFSCQEHHVTRDLTDCHGDSDPVAGGVGRNCVFTTPSGEERSSNSVLAQPKVAKCGDTRGKQERGNVVKSVAKEQEQTTGV